MNIFNSNTADSCRTLLVKILWIINKLRKIHIYYSVNWTLRARKVNSVRNRFLKKSSFIKSIQKTDFLAKKDWSVKNWSRIAHPWYWGVYCGVFDSKHCQGLTHLRKEWLPVRRGVLLRTFLSECWLTGSPMENSTNRDHNFILLGCWGAPGTP